MFEVGFNLLKKGQFNSALSYFQFHTEKEYNRFILDKGRYRVSLYGQARALEGMGYFDEARDILIYLITDNPYWETPYLSLGRIFEKLKFLATAESLFLQAAKMVPESQNAKDHYRYFLRNHLAADGENYREASRTYVPGFTSLTQVSQEPNQPENETDLVANLEAMALTEPYSPKKIGQIS